MLCSQIDRTLMKNNVIKTLNFTERAKELIRRTFKRSLKPIFELRKLRNYNFTDYINFFLM